MLKHITSKSEEFFSPSLLDVCTTAQECKDRDTGLLQEKMEWEI